jgi:hypothetical protein
MWALKMLSSVTKSFAFGTNKYHLVSWFFLRGLAVIYFAAFASIAVQIEGLIGTNGILPIESKLSVIAQFFPDNKYFIFPTLFWFDVSDVVLTSVCYVGIAAAIILLLNVANSAALIICYFLYLSIVVAGQDFTAFQWDSLLLETGFLSIFLPWNSKIVVFLYRLLIARFMLMGGIVKLASGDPVWADLTALSYHYLTQPLPSPLAYYAYYLPKWFNQTCVAGVFFIEIIVPFFVFLPRRFRLFAAWSFIILQSSIILTGNYNFFNLLTILLCLFLFDDRDFENRIPAKFVAKIQMIQASPGKLSTFIAGTWMSLVLLTCMTHTWLFHTHQKLPALLTSLIRYTSTFAVVNNYGPFAIMTTTRPEIIVQGSNDGIEWKTYKFNYKPVDLDQHLSWNIPHQPRLDWQMWFAALQPPSKGSWFDKFMARLQEGSLPVLSLLDHNPFPNKPPRYVRALLYRYTYSTHEQRKKTGHIWQRQYLKEYWPITDAEP